MTQDESRGAANAGKRAGISEPSARRGSPDEAALLGEVFDDIVAARHDQVWNLLLSLLFACLALCLGLGLISAGCGASGRPTRVEPGTPEHPVAESQEGSINE